MLQIYLDLLKIYIKRLILFKQDENFLRPTPARIQPLLQSFSSRYYSVLLQRVACQFTKYPFPHAVTQLTSSRRSVTLACFLTRSQATQSREWRKKLCFWNKRNYPAAVVEKTGRWDPRPLNCRTKSSEKRDVNCTLAMKIRQVMFEKIASSSGASNIKLCVSLRVPCRVW